MKKDLKDHIEKLSLLEQESRKILDATIITLSSTFIALIIGFFKDFSIYLYYSIFLEWNFILVIVFLILSIILNVVSHHYSTILFRSMQGVILEEIELMGIDFEKKQRNIEIFNLSHLVSFILALLGILIFIITSVVNLKEIKLQQRMNNYQQSSQVGYSNKIIPTMKIIIYKD